MGRVHSWGAAHGRQEARATGGGFVRRCLPSLSLEHDNALHSDWRLLGHRRGGPSAGTSADAAIRSPRPAQLLLLHRAWRAYSRHTLGVRLSPPAAVPLDLGICLIYRPVSGLKSADCRPLWILEDILSTLRVFISR